MFEGNACVTRGQVTINHGANIAAGARQDTTVAFPNGHTNNKVMVSPAAAPAAGIVVVEPPINSASGVITVSIANITTATVAAGTAVVYNITLFRNTGPDNTGV